MAEGTAAEKAYEAALREIERVREEGETQLWLTGLHDLDRIPTEVADIISLHWLALDGSDVTDLTPVVAATELRHLYFSATRVRTHKPV